MNTMSTEYDDEKNALEKEIKELIRLTFDKAKNDSREITKTGKSKHIETEINSQINQRTLVRYYNQFILKIDEGIQPNRSSLDILSKYLGFNDFSNFCNEFFSEAEKKEKISQNQISRKISGRFNKKLVGVGIAAALSVGSYFGVSALNQPQCMVWKENHYETIGCSENVSPNLTVVPVDEKLLDYFHKIEISDTTTFFEAGKPAVWYMKMDGEVEFYSAPGNHPITGKQLKPVTSYMVKKYGLPKR